MRDGGCADHGGARGEPALGDNISHPALQQRTTSLKEHNVYMLRTDWTLAEEIKLVQVGEARESFEQGPSLEAPSSS